MASNAAVVSVEAQEPRIDVSLDGVADSAPCEDVESAVQTEKAPDSSDGTQRSSPIMMLVMLCMFQGYASMVGPLQSAYKLQLGISHGSPKAHYFTQAAVGVHYGKLLARLGHNVVFACVSPWMRVLIAMIFMSIGVVIPPLIVFTIGSDWIGTVFIAYILSGLGLGIFEVTFLSVITPLGKATKAWAIIGAPGGFATINILGLSLTSFGVPVVWLYWYIVACLPVGMYIFYAHAPRGKTEMKTANFASSLRACQSWIPQMLPFFFAQFVSHFAMENWPAIFYMFHPPMVPLFDPKSSANLVKWGHFFAVTYIFIFLGDAISRRVAIYLQPPSIRRSFVYLALAVAVIAIGLCLESLAIAVLIPPAIFLVFWGNGTIYGLTARHVDKEIPAEHNLAAYSFWCFVGDLGAILGGVLVERTNNLFCVNHQGPYEC